MSRPKVTWNGPTKTVAARAPLRYFMKRRERENKPRKGLRHVSSRRQRELKEYSERRASFLKRPENRWCPVMKAITGKKIRTTDVHHKYSRIGHWLNVERLWMAVSREGHQWLHENGEEARRHGWIVDKP